MEEKKEQQIVQSDEKPTTVKRGRPKKIEVPELDDVVDDIAEVTEIIEGAEDTDKTGEDNVNTNENIKEADSTQISSPDLGFSVIDNKFVEEKKDEEVPANAKYYVAKHLFKKGEECYLAHFSGEHEGELFSTIDQKYRFRPKKVKIREVLIDENEGIMYRFDDVPNCCITEKLVTKTLEQCEALCKLRNR